jgi:hypothetical protein
MDLLGNRSRAVRTFTRPLNGGAKALAKMIEELQAKG